MSGLLQPCEFRSPPVPASSGRKNSGAPDWKRQHDPRNYFTNFDVPHNKLLVSLINAVSPVDLAPVTTFGDPTVSTGELAQLRSP